MGCGLCGQTLDNLDGKQARRTGSSSPLGLLFDHGCDAFNTTVGAVNQVRGGCVRCTVYVARVEGAVCQSPTEANCLSHTREAFTVERRPVTRTTTHPATTHPQLSRLSTPDTWTAVGHRCTEKGYT